MENRPSRFQYDLLKTIRDHDGKPNGTAVKSALETEYQTEVNYGRLYPNLDTLVHKGFVKKTARDGRTNEYELTTDGYAELRRRSAELGGPTDAPNGASA